ncbi:AAEL017504-PA [Aedes aegypti]|uniref:AAEL017504-PA n=1 Tax=Aedes aegypti TaxID=7159 RepID=J9HHV2_AEDAE|nr:AAEL017504-PA [Aedes aegypti]
MNSTRIGATHTYTKNTHTQNKAKSLGLSITAIESK